MITPSEEKEKSARFEKELLYATCINEAKLYDNKKHLLQSRIENSKIIVKSDELEARISETDSITCLQLLTTEMTGLSYFGDD